MISTKKQQIIDAYINEPLKVGDKVNVIKAALTSYPSEKDKNSTALLKIIELQGDKVKVSEIYEKKEYLINLSDIKSKYIGEVGVDPFSQEDPVRCVAFTLESILFTLAVVEKRHDKYEIDGVEIKELNWNPYVFDKDGNKQYYQRHFVWSLQDKQNLIDSIYNGVDCGKIVVRERGWKTIEKLIKSGEKEVAFHDIVDGKQRLNAIGGFIKGEFPDSEGNYFSDLSYIAQGKFTNNQLLSYGVMNEKTTDEQVLKQFLKMNFSGIPQSKEHIQYIKELTKKI